MSSDNGVGVLIITPTLGRDIPTVHRCIASVSSQIFSGRIYHVVCSDGPEEPPISGLVAHLRQGHLPTRTWLEYQCTDKAPSNTWGATVRQDILAACPHDIDYVAYVDDDNVILPHFVAAHVSALEQHPECGFSVCQIIHNGPLPDRFGRPPAILTGNPVACQNIDTLQVMVRAEVMRAMGWVCNVGSAGYFNDGATYERLARASRHVFVHEILGVHL